MTTTTTHAPYVSDIVPETHGHTVRDAAALRSHGVDPSTTQPREHPVLCPVHDVRHPVPTFNLAGRCDHPGHYRRPARCEVTR